MVRVLDSPKNNCYFFGRMEVHVANVCNAPVKMGKVASVVRKVFKGEAGKAAGVNVIFCNDRKMLELNRRFRQISKTTDILSFPFDDSDLAGEIYISIDTAIRQAQEIGHSLELEIKRLLVHGAVHLLGHDHKEKKERQRMEAIEAKYL